MGQTAYMGTWAVRFGRWREGGRRGGISSIASPAEDLDVCASVPLLPLESSPHRAPTSAPTFLVLEFSRGWIHHCH